MAEGNHYMSAQSTADPHRSNAYNIFILVLTVFSLALMVLMILPIDEATFTLASTYDNLICIVFLFDFFLNLSQSPSKKDYFIGRRGWLDLLGSIPSLGFFKYTALLRLARLSRLARIARLLRGKNKEQLMNELAQILNIERPHTHFGEQVVHTKSELKHKIQQLKIEREKFIQTHDHKKLHEVRRQVHELKHTIRKIEAKAARA